MQNLAMLAHSVLFPVLTELNLDNDILRFLDNGGQALLFGETGEEYKSGQMSEARTAFETADLWMEITTRAITRT